MCKKRYLIIFDCDGVLVDSEKISQEIWVDFLCEHGVTLSPREFQSRYIGLDGFRVQSLLEKEFNVAFPQDLLEKIKERKKEAYKTKLLLIDGVIRCLELLKSHTICVASANSFETLRYILKIVKLEYFFEDRIFSAEIVSNGKPSPDLFLYIAKNLSMDPKNCIVVEDTANGIVAGKLANMNVFGFIGGSHCDEDYIEILKQSNPLTFLSKMNELPEKILEIL